MFAFLLLPVMLLAAIGFGLLYTRLANGPVSLSYIKPAIERQIAEKLGGFEVEVKDVVLSLANNGAEFRLSDVRIKDQDGAVVAQAPMAAMEIDRLALFWGQVSPSGIVLIRPEMRLQYTEATGLSLSFARSSLNDSGGAPSRPVALVAPAKGGAASGVPRDAAIPPQASDERTILRTIAETLLRLRSGYEQGGHGPRGLDRIGVRNALIEVDYAGRTARFGVSSGDVDIKHRAERSLVSGLATIVAAEGQNVVLAFEAAAPAQGGDLELKGSVRDLKPAALARVLPEVGVLARLDAALSAEGRFKIRPSGDVGDGAMTVEIGAGTIDVGSDQAAATVQLDHGRIAFRLNAASRAISVETSTLSWGGGNELQFGGAIKRADKTTAGDGATAGDGPRQEHFAFDLKGLGGHFVDRAGSGDRQPVKQWSMTGRVVPDNGDFVVEHGLVEVAGARVVFTGMGRSGGEGGALARLAIEGKVGPAPVSALGYIWPAQIAPEARAWVRRNVTSGQMTGGEFSRSFVAGRAGDGAADGGRTSLVLRGQDVAMATPLDQRAMLMAKVLVRLDGHQLEMTAPTATLSVADGRALAVRQLHFEVEDLLASSAAGQLSFKVSGRLRDGAAAIAAGRFGSKLPPEAIAQVEKDATGRLDGRFNIAIPLYGGAEAEAATVTGTLALGDVRMKGAVAGHDVSGGQFTFDLAEKSINADGDMLVAGVATKLKWQYILDAPLDSQPPIRLEASLDESDRTRLGIKINHIVRGIIDVAVNIIPLNNGGFGSKVRADMTKAEIVVDSLAWVKPAGRQTLAEFDVGGGGGKQQVVLDNLQVVGDGIAIRGRAMLDRSYQLVAFELPQFSIDRVTRLEMRGQLEKGKVWRVNVSGQTFEGRKLFRSLFQAGRVGDRGAAPDSEPMGIDLDAKISTVLGFWNSKLSNVRLTLSKRGGKTQAMQLEGALEDQQQLKAAVVRGAGQRRELHAFSTDAGKAFALVGFYPNAQSGRLQLVVNLDGQGAADTAGVLLVRKFQIRGDEVVGELAKAPRQGIRRRRAGSGTGSSAQVLAFDWMRVPFFIGNGQFILQGAELRGPVVGATIEGKADFEARTLDLSGTYVPLQGLNGALGVIPGLGQILAGPNGEGVLGMKFAVRGSMSQPEMLVNPLSMMAPGIFREIFQLSNPSLEVTERSPAAEGGNGAGVSAGAKRRGNWRNGAFDAN